MVLVNECRSDVSPVNNSDSEAISKASTCTVTGKTEITEITTEITIEKRRLTRYVVARHVDECDVGSKLKHAVVHGSSVGIFSLPISFFLNQPAIPPCRTSRLYQELVGHCCRIRGVS